MHRRRLYYPLILNYRYLCFQDEVLPFYWLAFILSLLQGPETASEVMRFVKRYAGPWPPRKWNWRPWIPFGNLDLRQYHLRVFSPLNGYKQRPIHDSLEGIQFRRGNGSLPSLAGETVTPFVEKRISVALHTTLTLELPTFVLVTLGDLQSIMLPTRQIRDEWSKAKLLPCLECTGIVEFQFTICKMSTIWARKWSDLLDFIDKALTAEVNSCLDQYQ